MSNGHSLLAPSAAHRWAHCTASIKFVESLNLPSEDSPYAQEGTDAHTVFAEAFLLDNPFEVAYQTLEQAEHLPKAIEWVETIRALHPDAPLYREIRVDPARFVKTRHCRGTADIIIPVDFGPLYVADLKFGVHVAVDVEDNLQLLLYALGALAEFEEKGYVFTEIVFAILQPRAYHPDGPIRVQRLSYEELVEWGHWFRPRIRKALSDAGEFTADPERQCRFCPAQGACRALGEHETKIAREVFTEIIDNSVTYKDKETLTMGEMSFLLKSFSGMRRWMSEVSAHALRLLEEDRSIPYFALKDKRSNRVWDAPEEELELYFDEDTLYERVMRSPAQVEKRAGKGSVDSLTDRKTTGHSIVEVDDPGDNADDVANVFDEVPMP